MVVEPDGVLKVMDFGIARLAKRQSGMTEQGMVVGTPEYMAPEQLMGQDIDARADIYATPGCALIYECLTGTPPLTAENQFSLVAKLLEETPAEPILINSEVPQALVRPRHANPLQETRRPAPDSARTPRFAGLA